MNDIVSKFRKKSISLDNTVQDLMVDVDSAITRETKQLNKASSKKPKRNLLNELFHSFVWLYAKMITPFLLVMTALYAWGVYYLSESDNPKIYHGLFIIALIFGIAFTLYAIFANFKPKYFKGVLIPRDAAPKLWAEIDRISTFSHSPPIARLYIDNEFNASASVTDAKGWGWNRKRELEVTIGLPLLSALSEEECASVIAHEFGHHHGDDSRRSLAIYYSAERSDIIANISRNFDIVLLPLLLPIALPFILYGTCLQLLSQKIRHQCEYDADSFAADVCGVEATGRTDIAMAVFGDDIMEVLWKPVRDAYRTGKEIPSNLFDDLPARFKDAFKPEEFATKLNEEMKRETHFFDSHPSTKDRLKNIGATVALPKFEAENTAAKKWLGDHYDEIASELQTQWLENFNADYGADFEEKNKWVNRAKQAIDEIDIYLETSKPTSDTVLAKCMMQLQLEEHTKHRAILEEALNSGFDIPDIELKLARFDLFEGKRSGINRLLDIIENNKSGLCGAALETLQNWVDYTDDIKEEHIDLKETFENKEFRQTIKNLKPIAVETDRKHLSFKKVCNTVEIPSFPTWQENAIVNWFKLHPEISAAWLHTCADSDTAGHNYYYLTITHINEDEADWCQAFEEFDSIDLPVHGTVMFERMIGGAPMKDMLNDGKSFPTLHAALIANPPFYVRDKELAQKIKQDISDHDWGKE